MKYCSKCGSQINDDAVVCINCGCKVEGFNPTKPVAQLNTNKGLVKYILLNLITFGIYGLVVMSSERQTRRRSFLICFVRQMFA